ncbi:MAG: sigma-70 family RNA polymerase sigma factor [Prevotella sp.]|jgi:RNA polymerase sigma-70 factor (ECF subfamily)|nr:sigma-70 family RNA polymerase sigma factor [Prevotella sp.]MCH4183299.1 sigma-70 family RNA polymerase sigma factor [Prevotella sp.]MCH4212752.1 sigma-70 family RNA polymerase sigma factor [Prevotella sp.]MCH4242165.1 sigma-70 family RNA polymerase sigma factor [Prevotella sp.]
MERKLVSQLFKQYYKQMYGLARTILYDEQESKDVVSDVFERLLGTDITLLPDTTKQYLFVSVRNSCLKQIRKKSVRERITGLYAEEKLVGSSLEEDDERLENILRFAQTHLSVEELTIFRYRFLSGMSYDDIACEMGISKVAVWKHLSHLIRMMKKQFKVPEL